MKKLLLMATIAVFGFTAAAQDSPSADGGDFNLGINLGLPVGDAGDGWYSYWLFSFFWRLH